MRTSWGLVAAALLAGVSAVLCFACGAAQGGTVALTVALLSMAMGLALTNQDSRAAHAEQQSFIRPSPHDPDPHPALV